MKLIQDNLTLLLGAVKPPVHRHEEPSLELNRTADHDLALFVYKTEVQALLLQSELGNPGLGYLGGGDRHKQNPLLQIGDPSEHASMGQCLQEGKQIGCGSNLSY